MLYVSVRMFQKLILLVATCMLLLMTACTERTLEIGFLSISRESTEFKVTNETSDGVIVGDITGQLPLNIVCSKNVLSIEINLGTGFQNIQTLNTGNGTVSCATSGTANVSVSVVGLVTTTTAVQGDRIVPGTLRWTTTDPDDSSSTLTYSKVISAKFAAPSLTVSSMVAMNLANLNQYNLTGTCTGVLEYEASFNSLSFSTPCDDGNLYMSFNTSSIPDGTVNASIKHFGVLGNYSLYSQVIQKDTVRPAVTLVGKGWVTQNGSAVYEVEAQFSETVTDFSLAAIQMSHGTASVLTGTLNTYSFFVQPTSNGDISVLVAEGHAKDVVGNPNLESAELVIPYSTTQPAVTLSSASTDPLNTSFYVSAVFSEAVTGFTSSDIVVTGGTVSEFTGSAANYQFKVTPSADGTVQVSVPANVAQNSSLNNNLASLALVRTYDNAAPTLAFNLSSSPTSSVWNMTLTFSEVVTGFVAADITVTNGSVTSFSGGGTTYNIQVTPSVVGTVSVVVAASAAVDVAGNGNLAASMSANYSLPPPTITSLSLTSGPMAGGTALSIYGSGFISGSTVNIGSVPCTVNSISTSQIACTTQAGTNGSYPVTVTNANGSATSASTYSYIANVYASLDAGAFHACAIVQNGTLRCWGENSTGALGTGNLTTSRAPVSIGNGLKFQKVSAGAYFTCGLTNGGNIYCWGYNASYQLGNGTTTQSPTPTSVSPIGVTFSDISVGGNHACAISISNAVYCWGANNYSQASGTAGTSTVTSPQLVDSGVSYQKISAGFDHTCGITSDGSVRCWGNGVQGQLGNNSNLNPFNIVVISDADTYTKIAAGNSYTCGLTTAQNIKCWGDNSKGQLGTSGGSNFHIPTLVTGTSQMIDIAAGDGTTCAVKQGNQVYCWGDNTAGQIGNGTTTSSTTPTSTGSATAVVMGGNFSCRIGASGLVSCNGNNSQGQVGTGQATTSYLVPSGIAH